MRLALNALALFLATTAIAQQARPIVLERMVLDGKADVILQIQAQVKLPKAGKDGYLSVRSGPGANYAEKDRLTNGAYVLMLGKKAEWQAVIYPAPGTQTDDMEKTCGIPNPPPANWPVVKTYDGPCRTGWIARRFVELLAD